MAALTRVEREQLNELLAKLLRDANEKGKVRLFRHAWQLYHTLGNQVLLTNDDLMTVSPKGK